VEGLLGAVESMDKEAMLAALPDVIARTCDPSIEWVEDPQRADPCRPAAPRPTPTRPARLRTATSVTSSIRKEEESPFAGSILLMKADGPRIISGASS
jgi:hypothetical protein